MECYDGAWKHLLMERQNRTEFGQHIATWSKFSKHKCKCWRSYKLEWIVKLFISSTYRIFWDQRNQERVVKMSQTQKPSTEHGQCRIFTGFKSGHYRVFYISFSKIKKFGYLFYAKYAFIASCALPSKTVILFGILFWRFFLFCLFVFVLIDWTSTFAFDNLVLLNVLLSNDLKWLLSIWAGFFHWEIFIDQSISLELLFTVSLLFRWFIHYFLNNLHEIVEDIRSRFKVHIAFLENICSYCTVSETFWDV